MVVSRWNAVLEGRVLGYSALSSLEPELNGIESFPWLMEHHEVPKLLCVYNIVTVLPDMVAPVSGRIYLLYYSISRRFSDAGMLTLDMRQSRAVTQPSPVASAWLCLGGEPGSLTQCLWVTWLPIISASEVLFV